MSAGTDIQKDPEGKAKPVQVVNLLVTPEQAETLSLASNQQVKIQLVLRNPLDTKTAQVPGTAMTNLFADPGAKRPVSTGHVRKAPSDTFTIEVINGDKIRHGKISFFRGKAVRAKAGNTIACFCAMLLVVCAASGLRAQATPPAPQPAPATIQDSANDLYVAVGKTVLVDTAKPIKRIAIGSADTAETHAINRTEIMVSGKAVGETSLIIWDTLGNRQFFNVKVSASSASSESSLEAVRRQLRAELPGQNLKVSFDNNMIFLRGTVNNLNSSDRAVKIASTAGKVVNLLDVKVPPADPQILLKVRFMSVDRNKAQQLGINMFNNGLGNALGTISTTQVIPPPLLASTAGTIHCDQSEHRGIIPRPGWCGRDHHGARIPKASPRILAEPNILAVNGKEASFLAGGEYPYPVVQGGAAGTAAQLPSCSRSMESASTSFPSLLPAEPSVFRLPRKSAAGLRRCRGYLRI